MHRERPEERRAAAIVAALTECSTRQLDIGDGQQRPDYALDVNGRQIGVLEVTAISSQAINSFWSNKNARHRSWYHPSLRCSWLVSLDSPDRTLKSLRKPVDAVLSKLEAEHVQFASSLQHYRKPVHPIPAELSEAGVVELHALGAERADGGHVFVTLMPSGGSYGVQSATVALDHVLRYEDNRKKLAGDLERRELFVWVDPPSAAASALSTFSKSPFRSSLEEVPPPQLPPEATAVWAALWADGHGKLAAVVWHGDSSGWRVVDLAGPR